MRRCGGGVWSSNVLSVTPTILTLDAALKFFEGI
jgi:hypothetical protein